jgi:hypothetical protein
MLDGEPKKKSKRGRRFFRCGRGRLWRFYCSRRPVAVAVAVVGGDHRGLPSAGRRVAEAALVAPAVEANPVAHSAPRGSPCNQPFDSSLACAFGYRPQPSAASCWARLRPPAGRLGWPCSHP